MKPIFQTAVAIFAIFALSGCGSSHEEVADEFMDLMEQYVDALAEVKDEASAKKAASKLDTIADKMEKLKKKADRMSDPSEEVEKKIEADLEERMGKLDLMGAMAIFITKPELLEIVQPGMDRISKAIEED